MKANKEYTQYKYRECKKMHKQEEKYRTRMLDGIHENELLPFVLLFIIFHRHVCTSYVYQYGNVWVFVCGYMGAFLVLHVQQYGWYYFIDTYFGVRSIYGTAFTQYN